MPKVQVELDNSVVQSVFLPSPTRIRVDPSDAESFDVVGHEYGHAVMLWHQDYAGHDDGQPFDAVTTSQTAWQEGFASFLPVALNDDGAFNFAGGQPIPMESLLALHQNVSSANALKTQGLVARALYDLYDGHVDTIIYPWQVGRDVYAGGVSKILDVLDRSQVAGFEAFWTGWRAWGPNPGQEPILAIRLNMIDLNTAPVWAPNSTFTAAPHADVVLNVFALVSDGQSLDSELLLTLVNVSNGSVYYEWLSAGTLLLRLPTTSGEGSTHVEFSASDELETSVGTFHVVWSLNGKGDDDPPDPCEWPCQGSDVPPAVFSLDGGHPNPFRNVTTVGFGVPDRQWVTLVVYDVNGRRMRTLVSQTLEPGPHEATWDGRDDIGVNVPSGVYFGVLRTGGDQLARKIIVLR
jgi:hypothetical protein